MPPHLRHFSGPTPQSNPLPSQRLQGSVSSNVNFVLPWAKGLQPGLAIPAAEQRKRAAMISSSPHACPSPIYSEQHAPHHLPCPHELPNSRVKQRTLSQSFRATSAFTMRTTDLTVRLSPTLLLWIGTALAGEGDQLIDDLATVGATGMVGRTFGPNGNLFTVSHGLKSNRF